MKDRLERGRGRIVLGRKRHRANRIQKVVNRERNFLNIEAAHLWVMVRSFCGVVQRSRSWELKTLQNCKAKMFERTLTCMLKAPSMRVGVRGKEEDCETGNEFLKERGRMTWGW